MYLWTDHYFGKFEYENKSIDEFELISSLKIVFFSSIIQFRAPTEGEYVYPSFANALGWLMVISSIIFIPGVMIYELIKAWKTTNSPVQPLSIDNGTPHYLRMLTYASKPDEEWKPSRKEDQIGRYDPLNSFVHHEHINPTFEPEMNLRSRL